MSNQKHDTGYKKRRKASEPKTLPTNPEGYARELEKARPRIPPDPHLLQEARTMSGFELALRRAVGIELVDANGDPEEPLPTTPIALNDFESLKAIVMHGIKQSAPKKPWQQ